MERLVEAGAQKEKAGKFEIVIEVSVVYFNFTDKIHICVIDFYLLFNSYLFILCLSDGTRRKLLGIKQRKASQKRKERNMNV